MLSVKIWEDLNGLEMQFENIKYVKVKWLYDFKVYQKILKEYLRYIGRCYFNLIGICKIIFLIIQYIYYLMFSGFSVYKIVLRLKILILLYEGFFKIIKIRR